MFEPVTEDLSYAEHIAAGHILFWNAGWMKMMRPERVDTLHRLNRRYVDGKDPGLPERVKRAYGLLPRHGPNRR